VVDIDTIKFTVHKWHTSMKCKGIIASEVLPRNVIMPFLFLFECFLASVVFYDPASFLLDATTSLKFGAKHCFRKKISPSACTESKSSNLL